MAPRTAGPRTAAPLLVLVLVLPLVAAGGGTLELGPVPCLERLREVFREEGEEARAFVPKCDAAGGFERAQCADGGASCWCVDAAGEEVGGTRGQGPIGCEPSNACLTKCQREAVGAAWGEPRAACDAQGRFERRQCRGGECWCVDPTDGAEVDGSRGGESVACPVRGVVPVSIPLDEICRMPSNKVPMIPEPHPIPVEPEVERQLEASGDAVQREPLVPVIPDHPVLIPDGPCTRVLHLAFARPEYAYIPTCDNDGFFAPTQCSETNMCWCADKAGFEVGGTRKARRFDCSDEGARLTKCQKAALATSPEAGAFRFSCNVIGWFERRQCHESIGQCWCVNPLGNEIEGSRGEPDSVTCDSRAVPVFHDIVYSQSDTVSEAHPAVAPCEADSPACQAHPPAPVAVHPSPVAVAAPSPEAASPSPDAASPSPDAASPSPDAASPSPDAASPSPETVTDDSVPDRPCDLARTAPSPEFPPGFLPECQSDGFFVPKQCFAGGCWCVTPLGDFVSGSYSEEEPVTCFVKPRASTPPSGAGAPAGDLSWVPDEGALTLHADATDDDTASSSPSVALIAGCAGFAAFAVAGSAVAVRRRRSRGAFYMTAPSRRNVVTSAAGLV